MQKHLEVLDLLAAGKISNQDPRVEEALREAVAFCRGALPLDEREENAIVSRAAYRVAEAGTQHACDVAQMVKEERAQARAEGYASGHAVAGESILECGRLRAQLSAAQAETARLDLKHRFWSEAADTLETKLSAAQAEIALKHAAFVAEGDARDALETKLDDLRTAAERYWHSKDPFAYQDLWKAIEASRT